MKVKEIMTPDPLTVPASCSILEAENLMHQADVRHMPVMDGKQLVGMLSDRDLRSFSYPQDMMEEAPEEALNHMSATVTEICALDVITIDPEADLSEAIAVMVKEKVGALPVVDADSNTLEGILSYIDVLRAAQALLSGSEQ